MAVYKFKAPLNAAAFPMSYRHASRSVLQPRNDIAPRPGAPFSGTGDSADFNIIQLLYAENVLPIAKGLGSVGYSEEFPAYSPPVTDFDQLIEIRSTFGDNVSFSPARGKNYVYKSQAAGWASFAPFTWGADYKVVTYGYVNGRTLIFYEGTKCIEWDGLTMADRPLILPTGYTIVDIVGNSAASNYHLLFSNTEIFWSTVTDVLDFKDVDLGAGKQIPIDIKGRITAVRPIAGGFMIYTTENVIAASFTNDASRPFAFREVQNSGGVNGSEQVTGEANAAGHYTYGTAGIQLVTLQRAETVFPETADFLVSRELDFWDPITKTMQTGNLSQSLVPKLQYLGNRFLFISYGPGGGVYNFSLVYDTSLQRWGKLRIDHVDINILHLESLGGFLRYYQLDEPYEEYDVPYSELKTPSDPPASFRQNYGFLRRDGTVMLLVTGIDVVMGGGVALFGHCQIERGKYFTMQEGEFDGLYSAPPPVVTMLGSYEGNDRTVQKAMVVSSQTSNFLSMVGRFTAKNIDIAVEGRFELTNMVLAGTSNGAW